MATAGELVTILTRRVRDFSETSFGTLAQTRGVILRYVSESQRVVCCAGRLLVREAAYAQPATEPFYDVSAAHPAYNVLFVHEDGRELRECSWEELARADRGWLRREGAQHRIFARIGVDLFVVHPKHAEGIEGEIQVVFSKVPEVLAAEGDVLEAPDESLAAILSLSEFLINLRRRQFGYTALNLQNFASDMQALGVSFITPPENTRAAE